MNNNGQAIIYLLMLAVVLILLAMALAGPIAESVSNARNATSGDTLGLDCDNSSISTFDQATCTSVDLYTPYFIGFLLALAGAIIGAKIVFGS